MDSPRILKTQQEIMDYLRVSRPYYAELLKIGLPVVRFRGQVWAHTHNIEQFFIEFTKKPFNDGESPDV